jgi:hypothetical protein
MMTALLGMPFSEPKQQPGLQTRYACAHLLLLCLLLIAAGTITCTLGLAIKNTGTLRLFNVSATGNADCKLAVVEPDATLPDATVFCQVGSTVVET